MRAQIILKNNWFHSKLSAIEMMPVSDRMKLEYCSDNDLNASKPKVTQIKEVPFMKNNPRLN